MVTAPLIVLLYDWLFVGKSFKTILRHRVWFYVVLFGMCAIPVTLSMRSITEGGSAGFGMKTLTSWQYAVTQPGVILHYMKLVMWPVDLCFDYLWPVARGFWQIVPPLLVVSGLLALTLSLLSRSNVLAFPAIWFFGVLSVSSSFLPIADLAVEHRMYLPSISIIVLVVLCGHKLAERFIHDLGGYRTIVAHGVHCLVLFIAVGLCAVLTILTIQRNEDYHDQIGMWKKTGEQRPANIRVHIGIADIYFSNQMPELAKVYCQNIVRLAEQENAHFGASLWLAKAYFYAGSDDQTEDQLNTLLAESPDAPLLINLRGLLRYRQKRDHEAAGLFARAILIDPTKTEFYYNRGLVLMRLSRYEEAAASFLSAIQRDPTPYMAYHQLGLAYAVLGQEKSAIAAWQRGLLLNPDHVPTLTGAIWILSVSSDPNTRNGTQALVLGQHLMRLRSQPTRPMLEAVAAAYAENGRFDEAVKLMEQAQGLESASESGVTLISPDGLEHRLNLYRSRMPYRLRRE